MQSAIQIEKFKIAIQCQNANVILDSFNVAARKCPQSIALTFTLSAIKFKWKCNLSVIRQDGSSVRTSPRFDIGCGWLRLDH